MCLIGYKHIINGSNALQPHRLWPARLLSRQEFWSGYPLPSPRDLPTQRSNPGFLHCRQILFPFPWALQERSLTTSGFPKELTQRPSVQFSSVSQLCPTLWEPVDCSSQTSLSITNSWCLLKFMSRELVMPSSHLILCHPLLLLPSIFSSIRVFSNESVLRIRWPKYWSFSFSIKTEYSGPISFRMDWFDLLAVQGTLKNLLQHHSSKASILWCSAFFIIQLSHPHMTTGKP